MSNSFANAFLANSHDARTENGMKSFTSSANPLVDLFFAAGASRGKNIVPQFKSAYQFNPELTTRLALWLRDAREGAGERQLFREILAFMVDHDLEMLTRILPKVAEMGRWDDLLVLANTSAQDAAFSLIYDALNSDNAGLVAKWMPRKGPVAITLRNWLELTPKQYRKLLVTLSDTVEQKMCARQWSEINYSHVPSVAAARYQKAFWKRDPTRYAAYVAELSKPVEKRDPAVKINAGAVYPYDVIKTLRHRDLDGHAAQAQWDALPNYMGDSKILPLVDVSGSMDQPVAGSRSITCLDVALSLGLYCADKNSGPFKDMFVTFSSRPQLITLKGTIRQRLNAMETSNWSMNTNLHGAFSEILALAVKTNVDPVDMPDTLLILSDMQFDACIRHDDSAMQMIRRKYQDAGYKVPNVVFWNLNSRGGETPVRYNEKGVALVSGFSPSIVQSILGASDDFTPEGIMMQTLTKDRYNF